MKFKRLLSSFLCAIMLVGTLTIPAFATELKSFDDVDPTRWSHNAIMICVEKGAISGTRTPDANGVGSFNPTGKVTLGQFLAVITRLVCPDAIKDTEGHWALRNYNAAVESGIIKATDFNSTADALNATISREDMAYILVGAAKVNGESLEIIDGIENSIPDYNSISGSRKDAVLKCYSNGLIAGYGDGSFGYADTMTREQMATVVCRLMAYQPRVEVKFEEEKAPVVQSSEYFVPSGTNQGMVKPEYQKSILQDVLDNIRLYQNGNGELCVDVSTVSLPKALSDAGWKVNIGVEGAKKSNQMSLELSNGGIMLASGESASRVLMRGSEKHGDAEIVKVSEVDWMEITIALYHKDYNKSDLKVLLESSSGTLNGYRTTYINCTSLGSEFVNMNVSSIYKDLGLK